MSTYYKNTAWLFCFLIVVLTMSCNDFLDINDDPNNPTTADVALLMPRAQIALGFSANRVANENAMIFSDMAYNLSESQYTQDASVYNNDWNSFFGDILPDLEALIDVSEQEGRTSFIGVANILKAYIYMLSVDIWGDVPYSQAGLGLANLTPALDDDALVYDEVLSLLDQAIDSLAVGGNLNPAGADVYYGGDAAQWSRLANTIKLRMYVNLAKVDAPRAANEINALISEGELITSNADNFVFRYGTGNNPENRHPIYQQDWVSANKTFYMSQYFMFKMLSNDDPRLPYYVYRQDDGSSLDFQTTPCSQRSDCPLGYLGLLDEAWSGYIGRDHGDPSGLPGDNEIRTTWGVYPVGGAYDAGTYATADNSAAGLGTGNGLMPFITASMTNFWIAEAITSIGGVDGDAEAALRAGIQSSMDFVEAESRRMDASAPAMVDSVVMEYIDARASALSNAAGVNERVNVIIEEKYIAEFGNGWEAWTDFRRTGSPNDRPASIAPQAPVPKRMPYGLQEITTNPNVELIPQDQPVFWDVD